MIAGVVVGFATLPDTPFADATETVVTVPCGARSAILCVVIFLLFPHCAPATTSVPLSGVAATVKPVILVSAIMPPIKSY